MQPHVEVLADRRPAKHVLGHVDAERAGLRRARRQDGRRVAAWPPRCQRQAVVGGRRPRVVTRRPRAAREHRLARAGPGPGAAGPVALVVLPDLLGVRRQLRRNGKRGISTRRGEKGGLNGRAAEREEG